jgi:tRNA-guanine family transglycosylase
MKFYVSWHPESHGRADPEYWTWFSPDGILIALSNLSGSVLKKAMALGLHSYTGYTGDLFLDGGAFGYPGHLSPYSQLQMLSMQTWLRCDKVSHLDRRFAKDAFTNDVERWSALESTIENAKIAFRWERTHEDVGTLVYVIQGWDLHSVSLCAKKISKLGSQEYALGSLIGVPPREIARRVQEVRRIIGTSPHLHLFGISNLGLLRGLVGFVDSFDSSAPIKAAFFKEVITGPGARAHVDSLFANDCDCPVCHSNSRLVALKGTRGLARRLNQLRAVHNAFVMTEYAHELL